MIPIQEFTGVAILERAPFDAALELPKRYAALETDKTLVTAELCREIVNRAAVGALAMELGVFLEAMIQTMLTKVDVSAQDFNIADYEFELTLKIQPKGTNSKFPVET